MCFKYAVGERIFITMQNLHHGQSPKRFDPVVGDFIPADGFQAVGNALRGFDEQHVRAIRRLIGGGPEIGKACRLKPRPLKRL